VLVFLPLLTFVLIHRPLTNFDMNPGPVIPGHYHPSKDKEWWELYATNCISYALFTTEIEKSEYMLDLFSIFSNRPSKKTLLELIDKHEQAHLPSPAPVPMKSG
jgi:hypothetical protein